MATHPHDEPPPLPGDALAPEATPEPPPEPPRVTGRPEGVGADVNPWARSAGPSPGARTAAPVPPEPGARSLANPRHGAIARNVAEGLGPVPTLDTSDPRKVRAQHLLAERKVQGAAAIHTLFGGLFALASLLFVAMGFAETPANIGVLVFAGISLCAGAVLLLIGRGLRNYRPGARIAALICTVPFFFALPIGTFLSAFTWWAMLNRGGQVVFTEDHRRIRDTTPHTGSKPGSLAWIITFILLGLFGLLVLISSIALLTVD